MDCVVGVVAAVKRGGGGKLARVSFSAKNGDYYGDSAVITIQGNSLESPCKAPFLARKSFRERLRVKSSFASSLRGLKNAIFSAKILESYGDSKKRAQLLESTFTQSPSFSLTIVESSIALESNLPSLRGDEIAEASLVIHKLKSSNNAQNNYSTSAESMDCHASTTALARNDRKNATILKTPAKDSRIFDKTAQNVFFQNATRRQDFGDKNGALLWRSRAHTWAYVTAESPQQSPFLAQNERSKVSLEKPTPKRLAL